MTLGLIHDRLITYPRPNKAAEENAIKEICQEIALAALSRKDFFRIGAFMGGTCLRILHGLRRFSEDLDFVLLNEMAEFDWSSYLAAIEAEFRVFGLSCQAIDRSRADQTVKKAFLKEDSFGQVLQLQFSRTRGDVQRVMIKLEIDTHPPKGALLETSHLVYPYPFAITTYDLPSLFASKCSAILNRSYAKGRDWYDFLWYVRRETVMNLRLLKSTLEQSGPYAKKEIPMSPSWIIQELENKIKSLDWHKARMDVDKFIPAHERPSLDLWSTDLFLSITNRLESYLT